MYRGYNVAPECACLLHVTKRKFSMYGYQPIPSQYLPAAYMDVFENLCETFTPANDTTVIRTLTGTNIELVAYQRSKKGPKEPVCAAGYQKAIWELREGHLRYCPSDGRLWRRDSDETDHDGDRYILNSWHPVRSIEDEYAVKGSTWELPAMSSTILREAKRAQWFKRVERGVRIDPCVWVRRDGTIMRLEDEPDLAVTQTLPNTGMNVDAVHNAERIARWLTTGEDSAENLLRMFATPWLEPFKQLTYVLSGHGGDGKTLIMSRAVCGVLGMERVFPAFSVSQYCQPGGYTLTRESMNDAMDGMAFAYDDEAGAVSESMLPLLRGLSTGTPVQARVVGGRYRQVTPSATLVLCTNQAFADSSEQSDVRRFVKVEFHSSKGRSYDEYHAIERFVKEHPAAFYAASCMLWERSDAPRVVNLSPARSISDEMYWLISSIVDNEREYGQPVASRSEYRKEFRKAVDDGTLQLLGLKNSYSTVLPGVKQRVVRVADRARFDVYRRAVMESETDEQTVPDVPEPIEDVDALSPADFGFQADYVVADEFKVARNWKQLSGSPNVDTSKRPDADAYAVVPREGWIVVDMDVPEDGGETGWHLANSQVGVYGSAAFPKTLLVRTPSGGVHAYYRLPAGREGVLRNASHPGKDEEHPAGLPIDLRLERKGYVVGPGSRVAIGEYRIVDVPDGPIPELSDAWFTWMAAHDGYVDTPTGGQGSFRMPAKHTVPMSVAEFGQAPTCRDGEPPVDMSPIPKGRRNTELHAWAYGRAVNHPDNLGRIEQDLYARGRVSGLPESELATIWRSIMRQLGGAR